MALFDKLFSLKRRLDSDNCDSRDRTRSCQINPEQVRVLLFKECDWKGRRLLFDSASVKKVPSCKNDKPNVKKSNEVPCTVEVSNGYKYVYKGPEADVKVLGEMIFGAVAMNCKSVSLKIHFMDEPRRLMYTKVFCLPSRRVSRAERKASDIGDPSLARSPSKPLNVPSKEEEVSLSFALNRGDSGFCGDHSSYSSVGSSYDYFSIFDNWDIENSQDDLYSFHSLPGRKLSTSSNGSWQRRTFQNVATRFDLGSSQMLNVPSACSNTTTDSQIYSNSSTSGTNASIVSGVSLPQRKYKFGLAVLITVEATQIDLVNKCVEHSPQMESLLCRLRLATIEAGTKGPFVSTLHQAAEHTARWLSDLIYGPKLQPMWLSLVTSDTGTSSKIADSLVGDLCSVLNFGDTKTTNFFISTLLTHVLTFHLGWVTTVSPYDIPDHHPQGTKSPYNALWAQLHDLCGSIGFPPRAARTIITGDKHKTFINKLLLVLTYFVRSGDVKRTQYQHQNSVVKPTKTVLVNVDSPIDTVVVDVDSPTNTAVDVNSLTVDNTQNSDSASTLVASEVSLKRSSTLASLSKLSSSKYSEGSSCVKTGQMLNHLTFKKASSDSSLTSTESEPEQKVLFVLGDDEKLIGLKNKSNGGKSVKKSTKIPDDQKESAKDACVKPRSRESPSKCCSQTLQHSKPIKHSGFKFEFDKYPQIVTNYMKSKNLEILDRHYIGKPGNLKLDNFQFDPTIVPPIQEERCETCVKCQLMESTLQTPTNASEMEYMNDLPRHSEPQYAKQKIVTENDNDFEISPKTFVRRREENTVVVNLVQNKPRENKDSPKNSKDDANTLKQDSNIPISINIIQPDTSEALPKHPMGLSRLKSAKTVTNLSLLASEEDLTLCQDSNMSQNMEVESKVDDTLETKTSQQVEQLQTKEHLNVSKSSDLNPVELRLPEVRRAKEKQNKEVRVKEIIEFPLRSLCDKGVEISGFEGLLQGGVTDHYVPDLIIQGTLARPNAWETELRRDLDLTTYLNKTLELSVQAVAIVGDTNTWEVKVVGRDCGSGGMSSLVGAMLDVLPAMWKAKVPANQCLSFLEGKLREFCVLSKTLADMLMSTDFCDIATLTKSLNIDVNDVPLLLAVATTHTPQVATRYGISYR